MEVIKDISRVCITDDTGYHFLRSRPGSETTKVFDNSLFHKRREQFIHILGIYNYWGMLDSECMGHLHYYYASRLVQVAENISNSNYSYRQKIKLIDR